MTVVVGGYYRHFKGGVYQLLHIAERESDEVPVAVYQSVDTLKIYTRPMYEFIEEVDREKYPEYSQKYRFELISE